MIRDDKVVPRPHEDHHVELPKSSVRGTARALTAWSSSSGCMPSPSRRCTVHPDGLRNQGYGGGAWGLYIAFDVFFVA